MNMGFWKKAVNNVAGSVFAGVLAAIIGASGIASAMGDHGHKAGNLVIGEATIRATVGSMTATGGYVTITNNGKSDDRLIFVSASFAKMSEIHMMENDNGVMKMRPMPNGAIIPAGGRLMLKPGGKHMMFMGVKGALAPESEHSLTLTFANAGEVVINAIVKRPGDLHAGHN